MKIGFVGLGNMGRPIARNLIKAGHELLVYNRTRMRAEQFGAESSSRAKVVSTPGEACAAGIVMTMLADDHAVEQTAFGESGLLAALPNRGVHVSLSTISPGLSRRLSPAHAERGQSFVAAPVFGRPEAAEAARLVVLAAGPAEAVVRAKPLLESIGQKLFLLGEAAHAANVCKLAGNFLVASTLEALGEAFALLRKAGLGPQLLVDIMNAFPAPTYQYYGKIIAEGKFGSAGFAMRLGLKDVRLILGAADEFAAPMPLAGLIHDHLLTGVAQGQGEMDWSAVAEVIAQNAGLKT